MNVGNIVNIMAFDIKTYEDTVLSYVIEYLNKNRYIEIKKLIPYIKSRIVKTDININEVGICKILKSLFEQKLIAEGSKFTKEKVLERPPLRKRIYNFIKKNPGVYYSKILNEFDIGRQAATWHLEMLIKFDFINEIKIENNVVYHDTSLDIQKVEMSFYLSNKKVIRIMDYFNENNTEGVTSSELSNGLNMHLNTVKKYLNKLVELNLILKKKISNKYLFFKK